MQTELSYVTEQLRKVGHAGWREIAGKLDIGLRTLKRIAYNEAKKAPRADTTGKLALYFRIREKRSK